MALGGSLSRVNSYSKKQCRSLFWRVRAAAKKAIKSAGGGGKGKHQFKFHYDPSSYALNFDDGCHESGEKTTTVFYQQPSNSKLQSSCKTNNTTWIYIIWVES
ncbi:uncharacterized protein LOC113756674 [Coffea eugenioides]|uniref:uncharacterized protein LOC113756674 n=1 Tax=Coffea eugenioides TaxID=49369 RepID=UPI000F5C5AA3|nr:uncharacterized protein LOC113728552 [Coffea arabica]XP_027156072.1 uncharacterized protein LOC113756674 [Coffea eugenioides]